MTLARWCFLIGAALGLVVISRGDEEPPRSRPASGTASVVSDYVGAGSCSATACHGGIAPTPPALSRVLRNEHTTWMSNDPHSRAYQILFDARSDHIVRALAKDPDRASPAHEDVRCLACHATPRPEPVRETTAWLDSDGVGCESCHGPARRWLGPHTTADWSRLSAHDKADRGMRDANDLSARARLCVGCHVGAPASDEAPYRDVNHDLIAAGHPRLNFELSAYLDNMPTHWVEKEVNASTGDPGQPIRAHDFAARAWAIGRLATLEAALELLQTRSAAARQTAKSTKNAEPWPEFTEYECYSCHHDLTGRSRSGLESQSVVGSPAWGVWNLAATEDLIRLAAQAADAGRFESTRARLAAEMARPFPDPTSIERLAHEAAVILSPSLDSFKSKRFDGTVVAGLIDRIDRQDAWKQIATWDESAQRFLALTPLLQSWTLLDPGRKTDQARLATRLERLQSTLRFPPGFDSPKGFRPGLIQSGVSPAP